MIKRFVGFAVLLLTGLGSNGCASLRKNGLNPAETMILSTYPLASDKAFSTGFHGDVGCQGGVVPVIHRTLKTAALERIYMPLRGFDAKKSLRNHFRGCSARNGVPFTRGISVGRSAFKVRFREILTPHLPALEERNPDESEPRRGRGDLCWIPGGPRHLAGHVSGIACRNGRLL